MVAEGGAGADAEQFAIAVMLVRAGQHVAGAQMTDRMTIGAPLWPVGAVVTRLLLVPYLRRLLRQRAAHVKRVAEASADQT